MQITLNEDYNGGNLVFVTIENGFYCPIRKSGTATIHNYQIVHGVTPLESGDRCSLFFLEHM